MKYLAEFMNQYGISLIHSVAVAIISYVSLEVKKTYKRHVDNKIKNEVIRYVCGAINQLYPKLDGGKKLDKAIIYSQEILKEKGIIISDLELKIYIESTVNSFKVGGDKICH